MYVNIKLSEECSTQKYMHIIVCRSSEDVCLMKKRAELDRGRSVEQEHFLHKVCP